MTYVYFNGIAFSPDGSLLAAGSKDNTVRLWDVATRELRRTVESHTGAVHSVAFSADGSILASGNMVGTVKLWDVSTLLRGEAVDPDRRAAQWVLSIGGTVTVTTGREDAIAIASVDALPDREFRLRTIDLKNVETLDESGLEHIEGLTGLNNVVVSQSCFSDHGLEYVGRLKPLRSLYLSGTLITDKGLRHVQGQNPAELTLHSTRITDAGLANLQGFSDLETLTLMNTGVTGPGLVHLAGLKNLRSISLGGHKAEFDYSALANLKQLPNLRRLELVTSATDADLAFVQQLPALEEVVLFKTKVTPVGSAALKKALPNCRVTVE